MSDLEATNAFYGARPEISVDGEVRAELARDLLSMVIEEDVEGLRRFEMTLTNYGPVDGGGSDFLYMDRALLDFGSELTVTAGDGDARATLFSGKISGLELHMGQRPPELTVLAEDTLMALRMTRRSRIWEDVSDQDIFEAIASDHSLTPEVDVSGPTHTSVAQLNLSDLAFARERARAVGAELWLEGSTLHVQSRANRKGEEIEFTFGQRLKEVSLKADLAGQASRCVVSGWDVAAAETVSEEADDAALSSEIGSDESGASILSGALGERVQRVAHESPHSREEARALAEAHFARQARRFVSGSCRVEGDARVQVGARVKLKGVSPLLEGSYQVVEVRHTFDQVGGYLTWFRVERPGVSAL